MRFYLCEQAKEIPRWMYWVRSWLMLGEGLVNLLVSPFGKCLDLTQSWQGYMLRSVKKHRKNVGEPK